MYKPTLEEVKKLKDRGNLIPIYRELVADLETPVSAFMKINRGGNSFLLESVEGGERIARYSFIGTEPCKIIKTSASDKINPLPLIAQEMERYKIVPVSGLPRFSGGARGSGTQAWVGLQTSANDLGDVGLETVEVSFDRVLQGGAEREQVTGHA